MPASISASGRSNGELCIWGTAHNIPTFCFVLEVVEPGLIVVKHHRGEQSGKYVNVAVLEGDQIKIVDESASSLPDCPDLVTSLLGFDSPASWVDSVNVLVQLAVSMRSHGRGGLLLIVPPDSDTWRESIVHPIRYAVSPPFRELAELMRETGAGRQAEVWKDALRETVEAIAGLTAVDGAAIMTEQLRAAGVRREDSAPARGGAGRVRDRHRADRRWGADGVERRAARRHAAPVRRAVCPRPAQRHCACGVAGSAVYGVRMVSVRRDRSRASRRSAAALSPHSMLRDAPIKNGGVGAVSRGMLILMAERSVRLIGLASAMMLRDHSSSGCTSGSRRPSRK